MCIAESRIQWSSIHHCSQNRLGINILLQGFTYTVRVLHSVSSESLALNVVGESCTQCRRRVLHSISIVGESYTQCRWRVLHSMPLESLALNAVGESYTRYLSESLALNVVGESCTQHDWRVLHSISIVGESYTQCIWRVLHSMSSESFTINVTD
jgi:hypothetical protein